MAGFLSLADPECLDASRAGAKAAGLSAARSVGLPVLPGLVVPAAESVPAVRDAVPEAHSGGVHAGKLTVMDAGVQHLDALRDAAGCMADCLVVRSSSPLEGTGEWSGAFTSVLDVRPDEVLTAVKGVWASAVSDDALDRTDRAGLDAESLRVAVLVQPQLQPDFSGTAEVHDDDSVTVVVVEGSPVPLMSGWDPGHVARRDNVGALDGADAVEMAGEALLRGVADLACTVRRDLGDNLIEWASTADGIVLLQNKATSRTAEPPSRQPAATPPVELPGNAVAVAYSALRYAGAAGERLVLPWLLAGEAPAPPLPSTDNTTGRVPTEDGPAAWDEVMELAAALAAETWPGGETAAALTIAALRGDHADEALERLAGLPRADDDRASRLMTLLGHVAQRLVDIGVLARHDQLWALEPREVRQLLIDGGQPDAGSAAQRAALRWSPFAYTAAMSHGEHATGIPASPGEGVGPAVFLDSRPERITLPPRAVIVAPRPVPYLSPLLWGAAGLVTFGGGPAAHLVEVARSLTVPAVVGCAAQGLLGAQDPAALVAVDGDRGIAAVGSPRTTRSR